MHTHRYLESEPVRRCVLIDGSDIYTAGERHGRAYLYSRILNHCRSVRLVVATPKGAAEAQTLSKELAGGMGVVQVENRVARGVFDVIEFELSDPS